MRGGDSRVMCFGECELDLKAGTLRRHGAVVAVPPQQFTVLAALVSDAGALVTREQLRALLWGDDSFVDFDAGLNFCVRQLRLTLGDTATQPRFIQTVPRRGYRFVAAVSTKEPPASTAANTERARWSRPTLAATLALLVAGSVWWTVVPTSTSPPALD